VNDKKLPPNVTNTYHLTCFLVVLFYMVVTFGTIVVVFCHSLGLGGSKTRLSQRISGVARGHANLQIILSIHPTTLV
jgi:hypothetical protein